MIGAFAVFEEAQGRLPQKERCPAMWYNWKKDPDKIGCYTTITLVLVAIAVIVVVAQVAVK